MDFLIGQFELPLIFQVCAVFLLAITGAIVAMERKYDFAGVFMLAFITGASGAIIRDGVFLDRLPVMVEQWPYLAAILLAAIITLLFFGYIKKITPVFVVVDALGLGIFGIISAQLALYANLNVLAAVFIGLIGAISGGILRDIFTKSDPLLLKPGQYYITAALAGIILFIVLCLYAGMPAQWAALIGIAVTLVIRLLSYIFNWQTGPAINVSKKIFTPKEPLKPQ